jgi:hypothetical protein
MGLYAKSASEAHPKNEISSKSLLTPVKMSHNKIDIEAPKGLSGVVPRMIPIHFVTRIPSSDA